jgi:hypothetical protein
MYETICPVSLLILPFSQYHQLNHYNLFGGGYLSSARGDLEALKRKLDEKNA